MFASTQYIDNFIKLWSIVCFNFTSLLQLQRNLEFIMLFIIFQVIGIYPNKDPTKLQQAAT